MLSTIFGPDTLADTPCPPLPGRSPDRLPELLDLLPDALWVFDARDRVVGWNRAAEEVYRLPAEHAVGQSVLLFVPHDGLIGFARASEAVRRDGAWAGDLPTQTATGDLRLVDARWVRVGDDPATGLVLAVHTDVTARRTRDAEAARVARWAATRGLAAAVADGAAADPAGTLALVSRFGTGPDPAADVTHRGAGEWVLVVAAGRPSGN